MLKKKIAFTYVINKATGRQNDVVECHNRLIEKQFRQFSLVCMFVWTIIKVQHQSSDNPNRKQTT